MIDLLEKFGVFLLLVPAIVLHEVSHGYVAYLLGDPTAKNAGRLSLNPLKHVDPFGTVILPLLMTLMFGFGIGYAKPVPVNPMYFADRRRGMFFTGIAGPATNLALAVAAGLAFRAGQFPAALLGEDIGGFVLLAIYDFAMVNLVLMAFNLIPLPPLDGSRVLPLFLSDRAMRTYAQWERYGFLILFGLLFFAPRFLGFDPLHVYMEWTVVPLMRLLTGVAA
ncbi:MAG: site-2 protease family protein [Actinobacteria bacterium]|nr:MAG: site-2 protease family protein [Actinomycetota bacterium]